MLGSLKEVLMARIRTRFKVYFRKGIKMVSVGKCVAKFPVRWLICEGLLDKIYAKKNSIAVKLVGRARKGLFRNTLIVIDLGDVEKIEKK